MLCAVVLFLNGCGSMIQKQEAELDQTSNSRNDLEYGYSASGEPESQSRSKNIADKDQVAVQQKQANLPEEEQEEDEKRVYFGSLKLIVDDVKETKSSIGAIADESGGYIENAYDRTIIIRIPANRFFEIIEQLSSLGEVAEKRTETYDVSEFYQDLTTRLEISRKTRDRLYKLLERTADVDERLKILKEIRRLTEEIERIELTLESLKRFINFSRITVTLQPRLDEVDSLTQKSIPFKWLKELDPFSYTITSLDVSFTLDPGTGFAVFDKERFFKAESPDGVRIQAGTVKNHPEGDAAFWQKAVEYHLSSLFAEAELLDEIGGFRAVLFTSKDDLPFYYLIALKITGDKILVVQTTFPDEASYEARKGLVLEKLGELE